MSRTEPFLHVSRPLVEQQLLIKTVWSLLMCAAAVTFCYLFVDWRVARWVHDQKFGEHYWLKWPTYISPRLEDAAPIAVALLVLRRAFGSWRRWELVLLAAALSVMVAIGIGEQVKVVFGRPWPETWRNNNSSLIGNDDYTFRWFHGSDDYGSFPSGHTTVICAAMSVVWIAWPKFRWLVVIVVTAVVIGLVGDNYHFVGDVVAGAFLGSIVGVWTTHVFGLRAGRENSRDISFVKDE